MSADHTVGNDLNTHLNPNAYTYVHDIACGIRAIPLGGGFVEKVKDSEPEMSDMEQ